MMLPASWTPCARIEPSPAGASYRELAFWLRRDHRLRANPTTIRRYLIQLPEVAAAKEPHHAELSQGC